MLRPDLLIWAIALRGVNARGKNRFGALAFGTVLGFSRMLQGRTSPHTLWSLWWAWAVCVALAAAFRLPRAPVSRLARKRRPEMQELNLALFALINGAADAAGWRCGCRS